ncbi:MAG TPA: M23 family metallopeptidase, partial [Anaerolineaceae bacterium]|nr:M23 family metallopeptidase [Anaerolineaceae bacterium]
MSGTRPTQPPRKSTVPPAPAQPRRAARKPFVWIVLLVVVLAGFYIGTRLSEPILAAAGSLITQTPPPEEMEDSIRQSLQTRVGAKAFGIGEEPVYDLVLDEVFLADDGRTALLWLALRNIDSGEILETEPQLAVAEWNPSSKAPETDWKITVPVDADWEQTLSALPPEIVSDELQERQELADAGPKGDAEPKGTVFRGYKLPWAGGLGKRITGSIGHFKLYNSCSETRCRYAYDFADGTMFPLVAAKGGTVHFFHDACSNGNDKCTNSLAIEDRSTSPTTYQLYLHLKQGSIPPELRRVGAVVQQGQYIGAVDDTGYSSAHHLHFHVTTGFFTYKGGSGENIAWGNSVDIRFSDVD